MFKAQNAKIVLKLYEWLPPEGESRIHLRYIEDELHVDIFYYLDDDREEYKTITFTSACFFKMSACPGVPLLDIQYETGKGKVEGIGELIEYESSEAAIAWARHFGYGRIVRHFFLYLCSREQIIEVFAEAFSLRPSQIP